MKCLYFVIFLLSQGLLVLDNTEDNVEHRFHLQGIAEKPLPLKHVVINTSAKRRFVLSNNGS